MPEPLGPSLWFLSRYSLWPLCFVLHFALPGQIPALLHLRKMLKGIKIRHLKGVMTSAAAPGHSAAGAGWGGFDRRQQGLAVPLVTRRAAPFQAAGRHRTAKMDFSAKPYKEKAFEAWNWMQSCREGGRIARLCPSRDEELREKARKHVPCVPKWSLHTQRSCFKGLF